MPTANPFPRPLSDCFAKPFRRELLKFAVSQAMFCPHCGRILDVTSAVLLEDTKANRSAIACAQCSDRGPFDGAQGCIEVYDGRILFAKPKRAPRKPRKA